MLIHTRKLLLGLVLGGACVTTASAQELLVPASGSIPVPPPAPGVQDSFPASTITESTPYTAPIVETTPPAGTTMTPVPDDGTVTIRISDCPQGGDGASESRHKHRAPTAGWVAPGRIPMHRTWVPYWKFYPNQWSGQPAGPQTRLPVIYTPTDTTQLGYYYQHVPHWHSYANMTPPVPRPVDWHYSYQPTRVIGSRTVAPTEDLGQPQPMPTPAGEPTAPPPPAQSLDKSAAAPELLPLMR
ncbi:MAG: hypothetical protein JNG89_20070 [Planctomycetaceae bacterium]|nr:hypothetical protein [Planctomycetaceae bacterium]